MARIPGCPTLQAHNNSLIVTYGGESQEYYFGGNPVAQDETYLPARNALNNQSRGYHQPPGICPDPERRGW